MITAWAALESMAARLITQSAGDDEIATLRKMFATFEDGQLPRISTSIPRSTSSSTRPSSA